MFEVYPSNWPVASDPTGSRNGFHETALHEARVATDFRAFRAEAPTGISFFERIRLALGGGPAASAEQCSCPA